MNQLTLFTLPARLVDRARTCMRARRQAHQHPALPFAPINPFPFAALERWSGMAETPLCQELKISWRTLARYREQGLTEEQADRCAIRIGSDPYSIWDNYGEVVAAMMGDDDGDDW